MLWTLCWELKCRDPLQSYLHAVARLRIKGSLQKKKIIKKSAKIYEFLPLSTANEFSFFFFLPYSHFKHNFIFPQHATGKASLCTSPADDCLPGYFHISRCSSLLKGGKKTKTYEVMFGLPTAGYEVEHQPPPECLESARGGWGVGGDIMTCQAASHHTGLPA